MKLIITLVFMALLTPLSSHAEDNLSHELKENNSAVESLSPALRALLKKEMRELQSGMQSIIPAYVSGNWSEIEAIAAKMESSYILKQSLTEAQKKELHSSLPDSFIKLDQQFHYFAGMLKHVAKNNKSELVGFYFSKLSEACVSCHAQYAIHRFPAFGSKEQIKEHSH